MLYDEQRRRYIQLKADQQRVEQAASHLRQQAIRDGYAGHPHQALAFALALLLDEIRRHLADLEDPFRHRIAELCAQMSR
jgi:hypothetical protein